MGAGQFSKSFSCKGRGICPSCYTRRMAEVAAHLTAHVLPHLPVRQWVLSLPKRLRPYLHHNPDIAGAVLHRFGSTLNPHFFELHSKVPRTCVSMRYSPSWALGGGVPDQEDQAGRHLSVGLARLEPKAAPAAGDD